MNKKLNIAMIPHLNHEMSKDTTSGRQRVIFDLSQALVDRGHKVTIFGFSDYKVPGVKTFSIGPKSLNSVPAENKFYQYISHATILIKELEKQQRKFDIIHNHLYPEILFLLGAQTLKIPVITTVHTLITDYLDKAFAYFPNQNILSMSKRQKKTGKKVNWSGLVHNGINLEEFTFNNNPQNYMLFFGRMKLYKDEKGKQVDPKGFKTALQIAKETKLPLKIAGNVEGGEKFFNKEIKPHLSKKIRFIGPIKEVGPIGPKQKNILYKNAKVLLNPMNMEESFGLVMVEALACGTPVIAFDRGAAKEIIQNGINGFVVKDKQQMIKAISKIDTIDRRKCRDSVEKYFSKEKMAQECEKIYYSVK